MKNAYDKRLSTLVFGSVTSDDFITQLEMVIFLKPPFVSIPILIALQWDETVQVVTIKIMLQPPHHQRGGNGRSGGPA